MFKHILLPTDGSPLSEVAIKKGMQFARSSGARVTGLYVIDPFHLFSTGEEMLSDSKERYEQDSRAHARSSLSVIYAAGEGERRHLRLHLGDQLPPLRGDRGYRREEGL